ncbi:hypothetical protein PHLH6_25110 [Pseudomonas sp. Seg1]|uniref:DUF3885 domain-containing protein n=1 Tax=Pseudomonas sp. Seg1 TaxID=2678259 RepID=UPI001BB3C988|nr:DUF3885 domain-containing protein [Pseudomonas sp. Seg1]BBP70507.1 hypothetical protein PHLH6_25110 [Pseudomonas sp. Seg1]
MNLQHEIERIFSGKAFARPLFYSVAQGLRFELAESGGMIERFLMALRKAEAVCGDVFTGHSELVVCLRTHSGSNRFAHRPSLQTLRTLGIDIPATRSLWDEPIDSEDWFDENQPEYWLNIAFTVPAAQLQTFLWCALARDFAAIEPTLHCAVYLFNLTDRVMVFPYDDRGMDVVGPNKALLSDLYHRHNAWLLDYDRAAMDSAFAGAAVVSSNQMS